MPYILPADNAPPDTALTDADLRALAELSAAAPTHMLVAAAILKLLRRVEYLDRGVCR